MSPLQRRFRVVLVGCLGILFLALGLLLINLYLGQYLRALANLGLMVCALGCALVTHRIQALEQVN